MNVSFSLQKQKRKKLTIHQQQFIHKLCRATILHAKKKKSKWFKQMQNNNKQIQEQMISKQDVSICLDTIYDANDKESWTDTNPLLCLGYMSVTNSFL